MRLTREKIVHLSHVLTDFFENNSTIDLKSDRNEVRLFIVKVLTEEIKRDEDIDREVRRKILSMKSQVPEGSPEWDALYYKMYEEALGAGRK